MKIRDSYLTAAAALSLAVVAALLSGCEPANSQPHAGMRPPEVAVVTVQPQSVPATFEYIGQTAGSREVEVRARVTGIVLNATIAKARRSRRGSRCSLSIRRPLKWPLHEPKPRSPAPRRSSPRQSATAHASSLCSNQGREPEGFRRRGFGGAGGRGRGEDRACQPGRTHASTSATPGSRRRLPASPAARSAPRGTTSPVRRSADDGIADRSDLRSVQRLRRGARQARPRSRLGTPGPAPRPALEVTVKLADGSVYSESGKPNFTDVRVSGSTSTSEARAELPNPAGFLHPGQFVRVTLKGAERPPLSWCRSARCSKAPKASSCMSSTPRARPSPGRSSWATGTAMPGLSRQVSTPETG